MVPISTTSGTIQTAFERSLRVDVANGDAGRETMRAYHLHARQWLAWCEQNGVNGDRATAVDIKEYRRFLVDHDYAPASIALILTVIRQYYRAGVQSGLRLDNPVDGIRPPRDKRSSEDIKHLSEAELNDVLDTIGRGRGVKDLRDLAIVGLMALHGLRGIEIERANAEDVSHSGDNVTFLAHGKFHDRTVFLRSDIADALENYRQSTYIRDGALFRSIDRAMPGHRLTSRGVRKIVDGYLRKADVKRAGLSSHALRHTAATLAYHYTHNLRSVQDMLGHVDPKTTARYAQLVDRAESNPANAVPVHI